MLTTEVREKRSGQLPSVSQQVQLGGTLLGNPRTALEWGDLEFTGGGAVPVATAWQVERRDFSLD